MLGSSKHSAQAAGQSHWAGHIAPHMHPAASRLTPHRSLKQHRQPCSVQTRAYTQAAQQAIRCAQQEACRQGSMFLAPPHLLQGLLDAEGCSACQVLNAAGLSADKAEAVLVDPQMVPAHSTVSAGDLHWAPDARKALQIAAELCTYTGQPAAGTPHLLLGLLDCNNSAVKKALDKAGVNAADLRTKAEAAAKSCDEPAAAAPQQAASAEDQAAQLVQQYKQWVSQHGDEAPGGSWQQGRQPPARTAADDDIYE